MARCAKETSNQTSSGGRSFLRELVCRQLKEDCELALRGSRLPGLRTIADYLLTRSIDVECSGWEIRT
jgi:hypothetical protein